MNIKAFFTGGCMHGRSIELEHGIEKGIPSGMKFGRYIPGGRWPAHVYKRIYAYVLVTWCNPGAPLAFYSLVENNQPTALGAVNKPTNRKSKSVRGRGNAVAVEPNREAIAQLGVQKQEERRRLKQMLKQKAKGNGKQASE